MTIRQENRGGRRPNQAGRPKKEVDYDSNFKDAVLEAAAQLQKEHGCTIEYAVLSLCYDDNCQASVKASIWKTYCEMFTVKRAEKDVSVSTITGPRIGLLPILRPDPALEIVKGGTVKPK
jgi:hypothetical protein